MCVGGMQPRQFVVGSLIGILLLHFIALTAPFTFSWPGLTMFLVMVYITGCLGITLGFHRLLSHGSFKVPKVFTYLLTLFGCLAMQGGPIRWVATHRLHHKTADTPEDPHSPTQGFWWAHLVWNLTVTLNWLLRKILSILHPICVEIRSLDFWTVISFS